LCYLFFISNVSTILQKIGNKQKQRQNHTKTAKAQQRGEGGSTIAGSAWLAKLIT